MARDGTPLNKAIKLLEQCKDTLLWQVGTGIPVVDFIFPKLTQALNLLVPEDTPELDYVHEESTTAGELDKLYSFDFVLPIDKYDED